jgi:hypothetical protein
MVKPMNGITNQLLDSKFTQCKIVTNSSINHAHDDKMTKAWLTSFGTGQVLLFKVGGSFIGF